MFINYNFWLNYKNYLKSLQNLLKCQKSVPNPAQHPKIKLLPHNSNEEEEDPQVELKLAERSRSHYSKQKRTSRPTSIKCSSMWMWKSVSRERLCRSWTPSFSKSTERSQEKLPTCLEVKSWPWAPTPCNVQSNLLFLESSASIPSQKEPRPLLSTSNLEKLLLLSEM